VDECVPKPIEGAVMPITEFSEPRARRSHSRSTLRRRRPDARIVPVPAGVTRALDDLAAKSLIAA
jgi:hypothetical protein